MERTVTHKKAKMASGEEEEHRRESVLVTGASGRLGNAVTRELVTSGKIVKALVSRREDIYKLPQGCIPVLGNVLQEGALEHATRDIDVVYHFAAIVSQYKESAERIIEVNVEGTRNLLAACEKSGVGKFIFPSSVDVYGQKRKGVINEDTVLKPTDMYGLSKKLAEEAIEEFAGSFSHSILRLAAIYGPGFEKSFFKIFRIIKDGKAYIVGNGENVLPLVHVTDAVGAMMLANDKNDGRRNFLCNISDGGTHTQKALFGLVAELLSVKKPSGHLSSIVVKMMAKRMGIDSDELRFIMADRIIDISRARAELGYVPRIGIFEGSKDLVDRFMKHEKKM